MTRLKRVRLIDPELVPSSSGNLDAATLLPCNDNEDPPSNDTKTSEYAFFKKLKKDVACNLQKKLPLKENSQLRHSKLSNHLEGNRHVKDFKRITTLGKAVPCDVDSPPTPPFIASKRSNLPRTVENAYDNSKHPLLNTRNISDNDRSLSSASLKTPPYMNENSLGSEAATHSIFSEIDYKVTDIFSMKRAKLQKLIIKTLFSESEVPSKRCDLVSLLLQRLLPESIEINSKKTETETKAQSPAAVNANCSSLRQLLKFEEQENLDKVSVLSCPNNCRESSFPNRELVRSCVPAIECSERELFKCGRSREEPSYFTDHEYKQPQYDRSLVSSRSVVPLDSGRVQGQFLSYHPPRSLRSRHHDQTLAFCGMDEISESFEAAYGNINIHEYLKSNSRWNLDQCTASSFNMGSESALGFSSEKYSSLAASTNGMDLGNSDDFEFKRKPQALFLGWDRLSTTSYDPKVDVLYQTRSSIYTSPSAQDLALERYSMEDDFVANRSQFSPPCSYRRTLKQPIQTKGCYGFERFDEGSSCFRLPAPDRKCSSPIIRKVVHWGSPLSTAIENISSVPTRDVYNTAHAVVAYNALQLPPREVSYSSDHLLLMGGESCMKSLKNQYSDDDHYSMGLTRCWGSKASPYEERLFLPSGLRELGSTDTEPEMCSQYAYF